MPMNAEALRSLPGAEIVLAGLADLEHGRESEHADAVLMASQRLRSAGFVIPAVAADRPAAHRLYERLAEDDPRGAHSRYNAIVRRVVSFARAAERVRTR